MPSALLTTSGPREWRTLLVLGRVSNLPTVWSNCLAGWLLSGGGNWRRFALLCLGATCLYLGGMFLNDAFDLDFDTQHRPERPIPSGTITHGKVWGWGFGWLLSGLVILSLLNWTTLWLALALALCIVVYDAVHKWFTLAPLLMASCRWLLYVVASAAPRGRIAGLAVWSGLALALYVTGLSYLARGERLRHRAPIWPCWLLAAPVVLAWVVDAGAFRGRAIALALIVGIWVIASLRHAYAASNRSIGRTVAGLLAGICLVDLLAVCDGVSAAVIFGLLFAAALLFQRYVPAT